MLGPGAWLCSLKGMMEWKKNGWIRRSSGVYRKGGKKKKTADGISVNLHISVGMPVRTPQLLHPTCMRKKTFLGGKYWALFSRPHCRLLNSARIPTYRYYEGESTKFFKNCSCPGVFLIPFLLKAHSYQSIVVKLAFLLCIFGAHLPWSYALRCHSFSNTSQQSI